LINTSGAIILLIYVIIAIGEIRLRQRLERDGVSLPLKMWLFPWLSWGVIAGIGVVLVLMATEPEQRTQLLWSALSAAVIGIAYFLRQRAAASALAPG